MEIVVDGVTIKRGRGRPTKAESEAIKAAKEAARHVRETECKELIPKAPRKAAGFLAGLQLDEQSIALYLGISVEELQKLYRYDMDLNRLKKKVILLNAQFKRAEEGNVSMLMWLGKCYLGQGVDVKLTTVEPEIRLLIKKIEQVEDQRNGILSKPYYEGEASVDKEKVRTLEVGGDSSIEEEKDD
jgi:hypothetical protein